MDYVLVQSEVCHLVALCKRQQEQVEQLSTQGDETVAKLRDVVEFSRFEDFKFVFQAKLTQLTDK